MLRLGLLFLVKSCGPILKSGILHQLLEMLPILGLLLHLLHLLLVLMLLLLLLLLLLFVIALPLLVMFVGLLVGIEEGILGVCAVINIEAQLIDARSEAIVNNITENTAPVLIWFGYSDIGLYRRLFV